MSDCLAFGQKKYAEISQKCIQQILYHCIHLGIEEKYDHFYARRHKINICQGGDNFV
jgi:hypothetical protein